MKKLTIFKYLLKIFIMATFLSERFLFYRDFKAEESNVKNVHHEILKGWEIDFGKLDKKFANHHLFILPYSSEIVLKIENFFISHTNLNQTVSHTHHKHANDTTHTYANKLIDVDSKFKFHFLTAYDILISTLLIFSIIQGSNFAGLIYFLDIALKNYGLFFDIFFNQQLVNLFNGQFKEFFSFLINEKSDLLKILNFLITFVYLLIVIIVKKKRNLDIQAEPRNDDVDGHDIKGILNEPSQPILLKNLDREKRDRSDSISGRTKIPKSEKY
jgi:hypothetical protein